MNKTIYRICVIVAAIAMAFSMTACDGETAPEITNAPTETSTTEPLSACRINGHTWVDATHQTPKTCSVCGEIKGAPLVAYFTEQGLDARLLKNAGEYTYTLTCGADPSKTTVAKVVVEEYKTILSDDAHEGLDGYEWKILSLKLHFADENAVQYGFQPGGYLWTDRYVAETRDKGDELETDDGVIGELFTTGISLPIDWNGVTYQDGWLCVEESITEWLKDETGAYYIDLFVTVSVRVPSGYDGFVFGLDNAAWEWTQGKMLHEVITDNTLLFSFD